MALGPRDDLKMQPRAPTTGLRGFQLGGRVEHDLREPAGPTGRYTSPIYGTWGTGTSPRLSEGSPPDRPVGAVRSRREPARQQRTQLVGGRPSAVRYTGNMPEQTWSQREKDIGRASVGTGGDPLGAYLSGFPGQSYTFEGLGPQPNILGRYAAGGEVTDDIPAWLTEDEFVIDRANADKIRMSSGDELRGALADLAVDIKTGRPPGLRSPAGRQDFRGGGAVKYENQPGYQIGGLATAPPDFQLRPEPEPAPVRRSPFEAEQVTARGTSSSPRFDFGTKPGYKAPDRQYGWVNPLDIFGTESDKEAAKHGGHPADRQARAASGVRSEVDRQASSRAINERDRSAREYAESQGLNANHFVNWIRTTGYTSVAPNGTLYEGSMPSGNALSHPGWDRFQQSLAQRDAEREEEAARRAREQGWATQSQLNQERRQAAVERGAGLRRQAGEFAREEHAINTAQAARAAMATSSVQPMEASLSRASQLQLRSALQGALIQSAANLEAERMAFQGEVDAINAEMAITQQRIDAETDEIKRLQLDERLREQDRQRRFSEQRAAEAAMKLAKAQDPGFLRSIAPGLIQGGAMLLGNVLFPGGGGMIAGAAAGQALASDRAAYLNYSGNARAGYSPISGAG